MNSSKYLWHGFYQFCVRPNMVDMIGIHQWSADRILLNGICIILEIVPRSHGAVNELTNRFRMWSKLHSEVKRSLCDVTISISCPIEKKVAPNCVPFEINSRLNQIKHKWSPLCWLLFPFICSISFSMENGKQLPLFWIIRCSFYAKVDTIQSFHLVCGPKRISNYSPFRLICCLLFHDLVQRTNSNVEIPIREMLCSD